MNIRKLVILSILAVSLLFSSQSLAQNRMPDLKGKWGGISFLTADEKGIHPSNNRISLVVLKQSGAEFSGNIEIQENDVTKMRNFSGMLNEHEGYIWYFSVVTEEGVLNIGYLITKNIMKVNLKTFSPNAEMAICRLTRDKTQPE